MRNSHRYLLFTLGALVALAPLSTDLYLPALPSLGEFFGASVSLVQLSLTASMIGMAVGHLIVGPLSDKYGRKRPLIISMIIFAVSTLACVFAWDIESLVFFRLVQGLAGAGGMVIARSASADLFSGRELVKFFSMTAAVMGLAPVGAPVLGGAILTFTDWKGTFACLFLLGVAILMLSLRLKESLPADRRCSGSLFATFGLYVPVLKNSTFVLNVAILSFSSAVMFAYISSSPFIFQEFFGLSPLAFSLCFACNSFAIILGSLSAPRFKTIQGGLMTGVVGMAISGIAAFSVLVTEGNIMLYEAALVFVLISIGLVNSSSTAIALDSERKYSGTASAILGSMIFVSGGVVSPLVGVGNILVSTAVTIVISSVMALIMAVIARRIGSTAGSAAVSEA